MTKRAFATVLITMFVTFEAHSSKGFKIGVGHIQFSDKTEGPSIGAVKIDVTETNIKLGYLDGNIYYAALSDSWSRNDAKRNSTGVTVGYHGKAWYADGTYFFSSTYTPISGTSLKEGTGMGIDVGYNFLKDSTKWLACFQVSHKSFQYKKASGTPETNKVSSELYPMFVFGRSFAQ